MKKDIMPLENSAANDIFSIIVGKSEEINDLKEKAMIVSELDIPVLILGETGTGKEMFARAIHKCSNRRNYVFTPINCSAIPDNLIESELFGYSEGAFTGSKAGGKKGKFELADGGTIFLDEIGEMPISLQAKLLRVLDNGSIDKLGSPKHMHINVRVIAATNKDLSTMMNNSGFRKDLYFRISTLTLDIPPLRNRKDDILELSSHFINIYSKKYQRSKKTVEHDAIEILKNYDWPGNVRELRNVIEYAVIFEKGSMISINSFPKYIQNDYIKKSTYYQDKCLLKGVEKQIIEKTLSLYGNTTEGKRRAAKELGISVPTLYRKMKKCEYMQIIE